MDETRHTVQTQGSRELTSTLAKLLYDFNYHPGNLKIYIYRSIQHLFSIFTTGDDMTVHIQKLSSIADKLKELGQPLDNMQLVTKALATIPEKFRIVRSVWANVPLNERTIDNLLQRLRLEENVVKSYENSDTTDHTAFSAHHHNRTKGGHNPRKHGNSHTVRGSYQHIPFFLFSTLTFFLI